MKNFIFFYKLFEQCRTLRRVGMVLVMCLTVCGNAWADGSGYGFEDNDATTAPKWVKNGGTCSIVTEEHRTGSYSGKHVPATGSSGKRADMQNIPVTFKGGKHTLHYIAYVKKNSTADVVTLKSVNFYAGSAFASYSFDLALTTSWQRITYKGVRTGNTSNYTDVNLYFTTATADKSSNSIYVDDVVVYATEEDEKTDLKKPGSATITANTEEGLTWTNGTDESDATYGATGIQKTLIWKRTSGTATGLSLNDQGIYSTTSSEGPSTDESGDWTLVSVVNTGTTSYSTSLVEGHHYAIVHRDLAYNYSTPVYTTIEAACTDPTTTFGNGEYTADATPLDLSTLIGNNNSEGTITYSVTNANGTGATVTGSIFRASTAGTAYVRATQAADGDYCEAVLDATVTVSAHADRVFKTGDVIYFRGVNLRKTLGGNSTDKNWVSDGDGAYAYFYDDYVSEWQTSAGAYVSGSGATAVYKFTVPQHSGGDYSFTHVIFTRGTNSGWSNTHNQTWGYTARGDKNLFIINDSWTWDSSNSRNNHEGYWSKYTPSDSPALIGEFNSWNPDKGVFKDYVSNKGKVFMNLPANTTYQFRVLIEENEFGLNSAEPIDNTLGDWWKLYSGQGVLTMTTGEAGVYVFQWEKGSGKDYLGIYYPQARLKKGKYIYADLSKETAWAAKKDYDVKFVFKYYDSGSWKENGICDHDTIQADEDVFYTVVPDSTIGALSLVCLNKDDWASQYYESGVAWSSTRSSSAPNCLKEAKDKENWENDWVPEWTTYCPPMSSSGLVDNGTVMTWGGAGTEESPYLIPTESTIKLIASSTSAVPGDDNMTAYYQFKDGDDEIRAGSETTTYDYTASATNETTHVITSEAYNYYNSTSGTHLASSAIYYETRTPYTINYKKGANGTGEESSVTKLYGVNVTLLGETFTRTGYTQTAWNTDPSGTGGTSYSLSGSYTGNADVTLYPTWTANPISVTLAKGDHGAANQSATINYDATTYASFTAVSGNTGYRCTGYYDGETQVLNADGSFAEDNVTGYITSGKWTKASDCTLTAHWEGIPYSITYKDEGDETFSGTHETGYPTSHTYGSATALKTASKTGYIFDGWYKLSACTGDPVTSLGATEYTADITLYAKWTQVYASGSYSFDGNLTVGTSPSKTVTTSATDYSAFRVDDIFFSNTNIEFEGTDGTPSGDGNNYYGWKVKANTTIKFFVENNSDVVVSIGSIGDGGSCSISYTNQSNVAQNDIAISAGTYPTYKVKAGTMITISMSPGSKKSVTLKRIAISDTPACTNVAAVSSLSCSAQTGTTLTFTWTKAANASGYTATLYSDSGCESEVTHTDLNSGNTETVTFTSLSPNTTYYCKVLSHGNGTTYCEDGGETSAQSGTTLAQYDVTITVNPSGYGSVTESSLDDVDAGTEISTSSNSLTIGETTITASPAATTAQYTYAFTGWTDNESAALPDALAGDLVVYANFSQTPNSYSLTWNTNGGSDLAGDPTSGTVVYNTTLTFPTDPTLSNYTFDGWKTNNDGTGTAAAAKMPAATTTYYAAWKQTITLKTGSQGSGADITSAYVYLNGVAVNSYSAHDVSGCNLLGYYTEASAGTKVLNADGTFADDNVEDYITSGKWSRSGTTTLYAQWDAPLITWTLTTNSTSWSQASYTNNATYVTGGSISTTADENGGSKNSSATCRVDLASASDNVSKAASFSFEIYLGSKYIEPSKVECQVFNAGSGSGGDLSYKAQLKDEVGHEYYSTNTVVPANEAELTDATFNFASSLVLRGDVTLKVYAWKSGSKGDAFRMGPTVKLYGTEKDHVCSAPAAPTITGASTYATGATITLTASCASGADALTTYTWYKGDNYGMALVNDAIQAAAKASEGGNVLTINTCDADDAGTYWCNASNGVGCIEHNATGKMVMIADGYTITYNANGGSGSAPAAGKYVAGTTATIAGKNTLSKSGYAFMGWNTANDGTGTFYAVGSTFAMPASNMTLYAQWVSNDCGTGISVFDGTTDATQTTKATKYKQNTRWEDDDTDFAITCNNVKDGLVDVSGYTQTGLTKTTYAKAIQAGGSGTGNNIKLEIPSGYTASLFLVYGSTDGTTRYISINSGEVATPSSSGGNKWNGSISGASTLHQATISGLAAGTDYYITQSAGNVVYAEIKVTLTPSSGCVTTYDVSFANMTGFGGTTTLPSTIEDVPTGSKIAQPASPVASGYKFDGWYSNAGCTAGNEINWSTMTITANKTIYAKWTDLSGKYTFHYGIGDPEDNSWVIVPFAQVGSTSKYQLENFEIPDADEYPYFFVGYEGAFADHSHIYEWDATYTSLTKTYGQLPVAYANGYGSAIGNYALCASGKMAEGAKGTLHISSESTSDNYLLKFVPKGYALKWNGGTTELHATTNPKIFETNKVTLSSADVEGNFEVQIATSSSYVDCARTATEDVDDLDDRKIEGETYSIANGTEGRFQIVVDEKDNFGLRFVPLINRSYGKYSINWTEDEYWTLGRRPNIDEDAYLNNSVYVNVRDAQAKKVIISKYGTHKNYADEETANDGRLYVKPQGGLLIATALKKLNSEGSEVANDNYFDVQIESDGTYGTGALITGSESANTQAYVQFYALARKDANGYLNQHFGIPTAQGSVYDFYNTYLYVFDRTLGASNENWYAASRKSSTMSPFTAYNLLRKESATGYYYMDGALNLPGKSGTKELICDDSDEDHDSNAAGDYMFANSWTAPIDIKAIEEEDFANAEATIYIFNAGSTYDESHADDAAQDATSAGQWISLPVEASAVLANELPLTVIPSMQGFLIKKTGTAATEAKLTLDYNKHVYTPAKDRAAGIEVKPARAPKHSEVNRPAVMKLYVDAESGNRDKLFILERADFSDAFDNGWDGRKILGESYAPQLYAVSADSKMSIDAISVIEGTVVGFRKGTNDEVYTISFNYDGDVQYYLNDLKEYVATPINEETEYTFTSAAEDAEARFIISKTPIHKTPTDISPTDGKQDAKVRKVLIDDHIYIIRGGRMYNATGALVK